MFNLISRFPNHISEAVQLFEQAKLTAKTGITNVVITGLGGSGIGGTITQEICEKNANVPILVNKGYGLPAFVNENTLLIACSYSGNTEETLLAFNEGIDKKAQICVITSGGILSEQAKKHNLDHVIIPGDNPPRSMLAYSLSCLLLFLKSYGIISLDIKEQLKNASSLLVKEQESIQLNAKELAIKNKDLIPVTYACSGFSGVATRWRQQFNENAKLPGWDAKIPEMNHNELVGWAGGSNQFAVYFLRSTDDYWRNQKRTEFSSDVVKQKVENVFDIWTQGFSHIEQVFYFVHLGDWISYYLSEERNVDIFDIKVIDQLKSSLSKI